MNHGSMNESRELMLPEQISLIIERVDGYDDECVLASVGHPFGPFDDKLLARMRIDGILRRFHHSELPHSSVSPASRYSRQRTDEPTAKTAVQMKIADPEKEFDVRVSIVPTYYGENGILRLLAEQTAINSLDDLAFTEVDRKKIRHAVQTPYGMILATGPTGSGKTTTLYTILKELNTREVSVITIEDPIEYSLRASTSPGQRAHRPDIRGRPALDPRQDPNIIMVGRSAM